MVAFYHKYAVPVQRFVHVWVMLCILLPATLWGADDMSMLKVGINKDAPPFSFYDKNLARYRGFCIDLARLLAAGLGRPIRFFPLSEKELRESLISGEIDFVCGYIERTVDTARLHHIDLAVKVEKSFFVNNTCLTVTCVQDLTNEVVVAEQGHELRRYVDYSEGVQFVEVMNQEEALDMVSEGIAKAFISHNALSTRYFIEKNRFANIKEVGLPLTSAPLSIVARRGDDHQISQLSFVYGQLLENRKYRMLMDKWFGSSLGLKIWDRYMRYLVFLMAGIGLLLLSFAFYNRLLKRQVRKITLDLQFSEKRYRELIEFSPDMITLADRRGRILLANQRTLDLLGYAPQEIDALTMADMVDKTYRPEMRRLVEDVFEKGTAAGFFKTTGRDGAPLYLEVVARTIQHEMDDRKMACFFSRDISPRKKLEEELIKTERLAVMGQMAAGVAHEINNPLGIILANAEGILYGACSQEGGSKECRHAIEAIERNAMRAGKIIEDLLSFTKPGISKKKLVDVIQLVEEGIFFLRQNMKKSNVQVSRQYEKAPLLFYCDENQFLQLVINLMLNGIEAMPKGGTLTIDLRTEARGFQKTEAGGFRKEDAMLIFTVKDNGFGIPAEELSKIFDPFFTARKRKGFGLGLFISKGIVENHHGSIAVISPKGEGTTFQIRLPFAMQNDADLNGWQSERIDPKGLNPPNSEREVVHGRDHFTG